MKTPEGTLGAPEILVSGAPTECALVEEDLGAIVAVPGRDNPKAAKNKEVLTVKTPEETLGEPWS